MQHHLAGAFSPRSDLDGGAEALGSLLRDSFGALPTMRSTRTTIVLSSVKESAQMPLPPGPARAGKTSRRKPRGQGKGSK